MAIPKGCKPHREAVWCLHAMRLKIRSSHLTCKVANKCLNFLDGKEVEQRHKNAPLSFLVVLWYLRKKNPVRKKSKKYLCPM